jgi:quercetin dioxygenase-like cupin family protein
MEKKTAVTRGQVLDLKEAAPIQPDAIVSRLLLESDRGNVTLFSFDEGQRLSEHSAPFDVLVHVLDGSMEIRLKDVPQTLCAGEALVMPADVPHALKALKPTRLVLTMIRA